MSIIEIYLGKDCDEVDWLKFFQKQRTKELIIAFQFYSTLPSSKTSGFSRGTLSRWHRHCSLFVDVVVFRLYLFLHRAISMQ